VKYRRGIPKIHAMGGLHSRGVNSRFVSCTRPIYLEPESRLVSSVALLLLLRRYKGPARLRGFVFYPRGSAMWPQCWLCAVCAVGRVGCCVSGGISCGGKHIIKDSISQSTRTPQLGLHKIFFYYESFMHESIILSFPQPTCIAHTVAVLLHGYCAICAPPQPPFCMLYTIQNCYW